MEIIHKKNTAYYLAIPMVDSATPANFKTGLSPTDTAYSKDGAPAWGSRSIADTFSEIGSTGVYEIDLTAAELNHGQVLIKVTASGAADTFVLFRMYTSGLDDFALASVCTEARLQELDPAYLPGNIDLILADTNELQTDWTNDGRLDAILDEILADVTGINGDAMRGTNSALLAASAPANFGDLAITVTNGYVTVGTNNDKTGYSLAADQSAVTIGTVTTLAGHTPQTGDSYPVVTDGSYGLDQLVRSTTPANTLDVNATGEAGIDLDNTSGSLVKGIEITGFNDLSAAQVNAEVDTAIETYRLDEIISAAASAPAAGSFYDDLTEDDAGQFRFNANALEEGPGGGDGSGFTAIPWNSAWDTEVESECLDALVSLDLDHLINDATAVPTPTDGTIFDQIMNKDAGQNFDPAADSLEAIRDRGDAAWLTGGGGSITDILNIQPLIPPEVDLANTSTWRLGIMLINSLDDLPTIAEITEGTISIDRKAIGGTSWSAVVTDAACSELAGLIYYDEIFDSGTGYAEGDSIRVTFKSQKITAAANDYEISDANGRIFYTSIRQTMAGTGGGANQVDLTIEEVDTTPIPDVKISIMNSDSTVLLATGMSDSNGEASFALDDGTYKVLLSRIGWTFTVPETLVVDESPETDTYNGTEVSMGSPPSADICRIGEFCVDQIGVPLSSVTSYAAITDKPFDDGSGAYETEKIVGTYSAVTGLVYWDIVKGATVLVEIKEIGIHKKYTVPDQANARLGDLTPE